MKTKNLLLGLLIVACLAVCVWRLVGSGASNKSMRRDLADELAAFVAKEASTGSKGKLLILAPPPDPRDPFPGHLADRAEKHMKRAGFDPVVIERVPYNASLESTGEPITREVFRGVLAGHEGVRVVLTLVGLPRLSEADLPAAHRPRIIVASTIIMPHLKSLPPGMVDFAIEVKNNPLDDTRADPALGRLNENFVLHRYAK